MTRKDLAAEEAQRELNRKKVEEFKAANELNKQLKAQERERIRQEDLEYQRKYREQLDKQERDRQMLVQRVTEIQNRQQARAQTLPPYKQFVPEEVINAQFQAHEAYLDEKERRTKENIKKSNWQNKLELDRQVQEKLMKAEEDKKRDLAYGTVFVKDSEAAKQEEIHRKLAMLSTAKAYKQQLQEQMQADAIRKKEALMTDVEKRLNHQLLSKVEEYKRANALA